MEPGRWPSKRNRSEVGSDRCTSAPFPFHSLSVSSVCSVVKPPDRGEESNHRGLKGLRKPLHFNGVCWSHPGGRIVVVWKVWKPELQRMAAGVPFRIKPDIPARAMPPGWSRGIHPPFDGWCRCPGSRRLVVQSRLQTTIRVLSPPSCAGRPPGPQPVP